MTVSTQACSSPTAGAGKTPNRAIHARVNAHVSQGVERVGGLGENVHIGLIVKDDSPRDELPLLVRIVSNCLGRIAEFSFPKPACSENAMSIRLIREVVDDLERLPGVQILAPGNPDFAEVDAVVRPGRDLKRRKHRAPWSTVSSNPDSTVSPTRPRIHTP